jgi:transposase InsO family protein
MLADWKDTLFSYDFKCLYRPGLLNIIPDALSRAFPDELWKKEKITKVRQHMIAANSTRRWKRITSDKEKPTTAVAENDSSEAIGQSEAPQEGSIEVQGATLDELPLDESIELPLSYLHQILDDTSEKIIPSEAEQKKIIKEVHEFGHLGINAMVTAIHNKGFTWPKLKDSCKQWIQQCTACQHFNIVRKGYHPMTAVHASLPGEHVAIDLAQFPMSASGNVYVLLLVDVCTRFVFLEPIANKEASTIAAVLFKLFCLIGFPRIIQSDNGTEFVNSIIKALTTKLSVDHRLTTPYHPRANGVAERHVRSFKEMLQKGLDGDILEWDKHIPMIQLQMNVKVVNLHNSTPFSLFYGRSFSGISDFSASESRLLNDDELRERLKYLTELVFPAISEKSKATQQKMINRFNSSHLLTEFPIGTFVMVRDPLMVGTLDPKYEGPFQVVRRTVGGSYVLKDKTNATIPRNFAPEQLKQVTQSLDGDDEEDDHYEVETILSHERIVGGEIMYKVKWKGYDEITDIPYSAFDSKALVNKYYKRINQSNPHMKRKALDNPTKANKRQKRAKK